MVGKLAPFFPMIGKFRAVFPTIGKIFWRFSNDWKKFSESHKGHKECGRDAEGHQQMGIVRQLGQFPTIVFYIEKHGNRFADSEWMGKRILETTWTTRDNS